MQNRMRDGDVAVGVKQIKVDVNELTVGMFISGLDRPWTQTPFPLQGFYIRELDEIKELKTHCQHVYIDVAKGAGPVAANLKTLSTPAAGKSSRRMSKATTVKVDVAPLKIRRNVYTGQHQPLKKEVKSAKQLHQKVFTAVGEVVEHAGLVG